MIFNFYLQCAPHQKCHNYKIWNPTTGSRIWERSTTWKVIYLPITQSRLSWSLLYCSTELLQHHQAKQKIEARGTWNMESRISKSGKRARRIYRSCQWRSGKILSIVETPTEGRKVEFFLRRQIYLPYWIIKTTGNFNNFILQNVGDVSSKRMSLAYALNWC